MMINLFIKSFIIIFSLNLMGCSDPEESEVTSFDVAGCMDQSACNHDADATTDDGSCTYAEENHDCDGNCSLELDCIGTCGGPAVNCPEWEDDPGVYIFSATFAGVIIINNEQGEGDILAAFVPAELKPIPIVLLEFDSAICLLRLLTANKAACTSV